MVADTQGDGAEVRGDAATSPPPLGAPGFTSTVVDELEDGLGAGDADGDEGAEDDVDEEAVPRERAAIDGAPSVLSLMLRSKIAWPRLMLSSLAVSASALL